MAIITRHESDGIIRLVFDQPDKSVNLLTTQFLTELEAHLRDIALEPPLRGVILSSGKPGMFLAGADLREILPLATQPEALRAHMSQGSRVMGLLESLPCATVAMIDGVVLGGGLELALACDYRVLALSPALKMGFPELSLGLMPAWGGTQRLSRLVGVEETIHRLITGEPYTEDDLPDEYLADEVAPLAELETIATQMLDVGETGELRQVKQAPVDAALLPEKESFEATREMLSRLDPELLPAGIEIVRVVMDGSLQPLEAALRIEADAFVRLAGAESARNRVQRFFDERKKG